MDRRTNSTFKESKANFEEKTMLLPIVVAYFSKPFHYVPKFSESKHFLPIYDKSPFSLFFLSLHNQGFLFNNGLRKSALSKTFSSRFLISVDFHRRKLGIPQRVLLQFNHSRAQ